MVLIPNRLYRGGLTDFAKRALGATKSEGGVERYSETLGLVANPWALPEWAYLRREKLCSVNRNVAAGGAATFAGVALCNTSVTKSLIVIVDSCISSSAAATTTDLFESVDDAAFQVAYGANQRGILRDTRFYPTRASEAVVRYGTPAATPGTASQLDGLLTAANVSQAFGCGLPAILHPGHALLVTSETANQILNVRFGWREREALPGELP